MARIRTYGLDSVIDPADKIIGTDGTVGPNQGDTKNFSVSALTSYISGEIGDVVGGSGTLNTIPMWTPDGDTLGDSIMVKDSTIPAPDNGIVVKGKFRIDSTGTATDIGEIAAFSNRIVLYKDVELKDGVYDSTESLGTAGQVLSSTGTATQWIDGTPSNNIVGSGTLNYLPMFTPDGSTLGDSIMFKRSDANELIVGTHPGGPKSVIGIGYMSTGGFGADTVTATNINGSNGGTVTLDGDVNIGNADTDVLTVISTSTFNNNVTLGSNDSDAITVEGTLTLQGPVEDSASILGTNGKILISNANGELEFGDQIDTTYTYSSAQDGSDITLTLTDGTTPQDIQIVAGNDISLTDNGNNEFTIAATGTSANTTYDLASAQNGSNVDVTLTGSDATTDTVSLVAGNKITLTDDGSNNITVAAASDVVTGSGTLNTIPLWTPSGDELGDSSVTLNAQGGVTINTDGYGDSGATDELTVIGVDSKIVIQSNTAGSATLSGKPNFSSNRDLRFEVDITSAPGRFTWNTPTTEYMRLNTTQVDGTGGNLGIGTTAPYYRLHTAGSNNGIYCSSDTGVGGETAFFSVTRSQAPGTSTFLYAGSGNFVFGPNAPGTQDVLITGDLVVNETGQFVNGIKDTNSSVGTSAQVLSSTGSGTDWVDTVSEIVAGTDISISQSTGSVTINATGAALNTTYDLAGAIDGGNGKITLTGSDASEDIVTLEAGTNITLSSTQANTITIDTLDNIATRDTNGQHSAAIVPAFDNTTGTVLKNTGITINNGSVTLPGISSIGPISSNVLINGTITATNFIFGSGGDSISDFEEGTWTPDIKTYLTSTLNAVSGLDFDVQSGTYMKINDKVFCEFKIRYKLLPTYSWPANEYLVITGLPFTPEGSIRNSNLSGNINRLSSFNSTDTDDLPRTLSNAQSPFYDVVIPTGLGLLPPQDTNSGTKPLLATLFSDQDDYTGGNYVEFYGSFTYTTT